MDFELKIAFKFVVCWLSGFQDHNDGHRDTNYYNVGQTSSCWATIFMQILSVGDTISENCGNITFANSSLKFHKYIHTTYHTLPNLWSYFHTRYSQQSFTRINGRWVFKNNRTETEHRSLNTKLSTLLTGLDNNLGLEY